jgi:hypothetical protein
MQVRALLLNLFDKEVNPPGNDLANISPQPLAERWSDRHARAAAADMAFSIATKRAGWTPPSRCRWGALATFWNVSSAS